jgi:hypothetical protein
MNTLKVGYILGLIGAIIMIGSDVILAGITGLIFFLLAIGASGTGLYGLELMPVSVSISLALGIVALIYLQKSKKGTKRSLIIILIIGVFSAIGAFIPLQPARTLDLGGGETYPAPAFYLVNSLLYIDPYLLINYALIGLQSRISLVEEDMIEADDYSIASIK